MHQTNQSRGTTTPADGSSAAANPKPPATGLQLTLQFDGGSRGNPGPAGIGVTLTAADNEVVYELGDSLGSCTNNVAEYTALVRGLKAALAMGAKHVIVRADSELVVRQMRGIYRVKSPDLKPLYQEACALVQAIGQVEFNHVYRMNNARADALANAAMDARAKVEPMGPPQKK